MADELHKFLFEGLPVRGQIVRLSDAWTELLRRRGDHGAYPSEVATLLGEMAAAGALMQSNIKFNGALVMQIFGDGPVKVAVAEVQSDLRLRATAKVIGEVPPGADFARLVNVGNAGRCAITLDPQDKLPGQQPYQGVVPLSDAQGQPLARLSATLEHYMRQSEQLETTLVLAADAQVAAGLMIQRLPLEGEANLAGRGAGMDAETLNEHYNRIAHLAASLQREELLTLDVDTILRRLFWEEKLRRFEPQAPRFACTCNRERVSGMIRSLGVAEAESIIAERGNIEVGCDFCGKQYHFDAVDAARLFRAAGDQPPVTRTVQ